PRTRPCIPHSLATCTVIRRQISMTRSPNLVARLGLIVHRKRERQIRAGVNYISLQNFSDANRFCLRLFEQKPHRSKEGGMISLRLVQLIEGHSDELVTVLVAKRESSLRTSDLHKVPAEELRGRIYEVLRQLSEWLLTKTGHDIEQRYFEIGERR